MVISRHAYLIPGLVAAIVALDIVLVAIVAVQEWPATPVVPTNPILLLVIAFLVGQVSLIAAWAGLGTTRWFVRLPVAVAATTMFLASLMTGCVRPIGSFQLVFQAGFAIQAYILGGALIVGRFLGLGLHRASPGHPTRPTQGQRMQCSIPQLLACMTAIAILLALGRPLVLFFPAYEGGRHDGEFATYSFLAAGFAGIALLDVWVVLGTLRALMKPAALLSFAGLVGIALHALLHERLAQSTWLPDGYLGSVWLEGLLGPQWGPLATILAICCLYSTVVGAALAVFRIVGYRYVWRPTHSAAALRETLFDTLVGRPLGRPSSRRSERLRRLAVGGFTGFIHGLVAGTIVPDMFGAYTGDVLAQCTGTILGLVCGAVWKPPRETDSP